jgi:hypothetical protein
MNSINASTGYSGFQLRMERSPHVIPPLVPGHVREPGMEEITAWDIISKIEADIADAKDALLGAKILQAFYSNKSRGREDAYFVGDKVMLATLYRHREYKAGDMSRVAKFFPQWDGPYMVTRAFPEDSSYMLHLPNSPDTFPRYHASLLKRHIKNNAALFPSQEQERPGPVLTNVGMEEYWIEKINDERQRGQGYQYLVRWAGYAECDDLWLSQCKLVDCEVLDVWQSHKAEERR